MAAPIYKGAPPFFKPGIRIGAQLRVGMTGTGAPTSGTSGTGATGTVAQASLAAGPGSTYVDKATGNWYTNFGTAASPAWIQTSSPSLSGGAPIAVTASGAIAVRPSANYVITKAGIAAMTLAAPTAGAISGGGDDGVTIFVASSTANAHTITATGLLQTGSAFTDVATFNASAGASLELMAYNGKWIVAAANGISFS